MTDRLLRTLVWAALPALVFGSVAGPAQADDSVSGAALYEENCEICHDVGGVGVPDATPPLVGNPRAQDKEYLARVIREGLTGPIEVDGQIYDEEMDGLPDLSDAEVAALVEHIRSGFPASAAGGAAQLKQSQPQESQPQEPKLLGDAARGEALFAGRQPLENGGPVCLACHAASNYGHLGGSGLGPDLTGLPSRVAGEKGLTGVLRKPPSQVMRPVYAGRELTEQEVADLAAFFRGTVAREPGGADWLLVAGATGALALFGLLAVFASSAQRHSYSKMLRDTR